ncbi:unnamed protein product [Didymodactylos carnosus]|uniref:HPP transmembrane region domain-containing protein n=1 Tax=Didymodactylos carnosus TaxID=1234261 RepID=A0A8S2EPC2_9BILA|nr:unnamed protein product [Didymodactylos carnosus]CAF4011174.1 unnamed protein product [Didymodactylos carnosus]
MHPQTHHIINEHGNNLQREEQEQKEIGDEPDDLVEIPDITNNNTNVVEVSTISVKSPSVINIEESRQEEKQQITIKEWLKQYFHKFHSLNERRPKRLQWHEYIWSWLGAFIGIALVAFIHYRILQRQTLSFMIGSFGASAVLIFGAPKSPLAQPRNLVGGHVVSAIVGCIIRVILGKYEQSVACALSVSLAIILMQLTETLHPPGGATALIAITMQPGLPGANFLYILMPVLSGTLCMLLVALIVNNLATKRSYPTFWW